MAISSVLGSSALLPAGLGFRNKIINGDFGINQRAFSSSTSSVYGFDRWSQSTADGTATYSAQTFSVGNAISGQEPTNHARVVTSGQTLSSAVTRLYQPIENVRTCAGQQIVVSFWAKAASGTPKVAIELQQNFGSGGSPSSTVSVPFGQVTLSTSWQRFTLAGLVPSISGKTIGTNNDHALMFFMYVSAGSNYATPTGSLGIQSNTFDFWGVQLEQNLQPTPFEQRPYGVELALCQRYYQRLIDPAGTGVNNAYSQATRMTFPLKVQMRASPTSTISGTMNFWNGASTSTATAFIGTFNTRDNGQLDFNGGVGAASAVVTLYTTGGSQYVDFSAEL